MTINFKQLISQTELFKANPSYNTEYVLILSLISGSIVLVGIFIWFFLRGICRKIPPYQELRNRLVNFFVTIGSIGLVLAFFAWQSIPYFSSRFLVFILILILAIWLLFILIYLQRNFSRELLEYEQVERYKKYLPRAKSKGLPNPKKRR